MASKELESDSIDCVAGVFQGLKKGLVEATVTKAKMVEAKMAGGVNGDEVEVKVVTVLERWKTCEGQQTLTGEVRRLWLCKSCC
jgi:hypothetical protein